MFDVTIVSAFNGNKYAEKDYQACAIRFMKSLRNNGGACKDLPVIFWVDKEAMPSRKVIDVLEKEYGCTLIYGKCDIQHPQPTGSWEHKVNAVDESAKHIKTEFTALIDVDMYFVSDPSELLETEAQISVAPMTYLSNFGASPEQDAMWDQYYSFFKLNRPTTKIQTLDKKWGNFYFTSAIIVFKNDIEFGANFRGMYLRLYTSGLPDCQKRTSQTILPIMITKHGWTYRVLPRHLHYLYHLNNYQLENNEKMPVLVHYCDNVIKEISPIEWSVNTERIASK